MNARFNDEQYVVQKISMPQRESSSTNKSAGQTRDFDVDFQ